MTVFGIRLVGINPENGQKLLFTVIFLVGLFLVRAIVARVIRLLLRGRGDEQIQFWARQAINLTTAILVLLGVLSIWFDDPTRLATGLGLVTAGLAFALQKVVTAIAGYFVILRGQNFSVGDRITMGGVRGDVIALGFIQTTIMEMGQPPPVQGADPAVWVHSRQYTGRVVTVSNDKIFDEPIYNYTRDFPYLWEEMVLPITYEADRKRAEALLLDVVSRHTTPLESLSREALDAMQRRYFVRNVADLSPKVYYRLTDNWLELTARFVVADHGVRDVKDAIARELLDGLDAAGIGIASATFEIVGMPSLRVSAAARERARPDGATVNGGGEPTGTTQ